MLVTLSRQAGTPSDLIGHLVADHLGLRYFDRELVEEIARRLEQDPATVRRLDEQMLSPVDALLLEWRQSMNPDRYRRALLAALQRIEADGNALIVGRGANFVLRGPETFRVRLVAPLAWRVEMYALANDIRAEAARHAVPRDDATRAQFIQQLFHEDIEEPTHYDLVVNVAALTPEMTAALIVFATQQRPVRAAPATESAGGSSTPHRAALTRHRRTARPGITPDGDQHLG